MFCCPHCLLLPITLFSLLIVVTMLESTRVLCKQQNVGDKTLFNSVHQHSQHHTKQPRSQGLRGDTCGRRPWQRLDVTWPNFPLYLKIFVFLLNYRVLNFRSEFSKYIGKFGQVTACLCQDLCLTHASPQRGPGNEVAQKVISVV